MKNYQKKTDCLIIFGKFSVSISLETSRVDLKVASHSQNFILLLKSKMNKKKMIFFSNFQVHSITYFFSLFLTDHHAKSLINNVSSH